MSEDVVAAAERLLSEHNRYEDYDVDDDGHRTIYEACEVDDDNWPCDTVLVAQLALAVDHEARTGERQLMSATKEAIGQALEVLNRQTEAMQRLAMIYPEAHHILSSPRKPDAVIILERVYWRLDAALAAAPGAVDGAGERAHDGS